MAVAGKLVSIVFRSLEIILIICALSIYMYDDMASTILFGVAKTFFVSGTIFMVTIITPLLLIFDILGQQDASLFGVIVNFIFGIFVLAAGSVVLNDWSGSLAGVLTAQNRILAMGSLNIINGIIFLADTAYTFMKYKKSD